MRATLPIFRAALACLALAMLALAVQRPAAAQDEEPAGVLDPRVDPRQDATIARGLEERLRQIPELRALEVEVEAGVVRLRGEALSTAALEEAGGIARRTAGVAQVINEIVLVRDVRERVVPALAKLKARGAEALAALPLLAVAIVVFLAFWYLARWISSWQRAFARLSPNRFVQELLANLVRVAVVLTGALLALEILDATALVGAVFGAAGVLGLALGFAFRDLVENYLASVLLSVRQPFLPNDLVDIDGRKGKVVRLTSRATVLMTLDGNHLRIPNSNVFKGVILNFSRNPLRRFEFTVGVGVGEELGEVEQLGLATLAEVEGVLAEPAPSIEVEELGDSTVVVRLYGWVDQREASFTRVRSRAVRAVKEAFDAAAIEMPEPIYRLHLEREGTAAAAERPAGEPAPAPRAPAPSPRAAALAPPPAQAVTEASEADAIDTQIAAERASAGDEDLLDPTAPTE